MPATVDSIINAAKKEWIYWGESTWDLTTHSKKIGHKDDEDDYAQYVIDHYCKIGGGSPSKWAIQDDKYAWSAVGMSAFMAQGGFNKQEFPFNQSHSVYIRKFITALQQHDKSSAYWGYRINTQGKAPDIGDLIAYARGKNLTSEKANAYYDKITAYESHTDLVIDKGKNYIDVIGANVMDSVTCKRLKIDSNGHIVDDQHLWFAVLKHNFN